MTAANGEPERKSLFERLQVAIWKLVGATAAAWLIAFLGTALGLIFGVWEEEIRTPSKAFFAAIWHGERAPIHMGSLLFWLAAAFWAVLVAIRLRFDKEEVVTRTLEQIEATTAAVLQAPNPEVLAAYPEQYYPEFLEKLGRAPEKPGEISAEELARRLREALLVIATMARDYARRPLAVYGANLMLVAGRSRFEHFQGKVSFLLTDEEIWAQQAVLYMPEALVISSTKVGVNRHIPILALPVPPVHTTPDNIPVAIPGAPTALLRGPSIHNDTYRMRENCKGMHEAVVRKIESYFSPGGDGREIRSFACFPLSRVPNDPVGVLNIDSNQPAILGAREEYTVTFAALLEPMLNALRPMVAAYAYEAAEELLGGPAPGTEEANPGKSV